jgi:hypothetical protein
MKKSGDQKPVGSDALTTAAEAIGSALGKLAVKAGIAKPQTKPTPAVAKKRPASRKKTAKAGPPAKSPAKKAAVARGAKRKRAK